MYLELTKQAFEIEPVVIRMCSPLKPASLVLTFFQYIGGFPLTPTDEKWTKFNFWKYSGIVQIIMHGTPLAFCM